LPIQRLTSRIPQLVRQEKELAVTIEQNQIARLTEVRLPLHLYLID
jgi:hypothetical protein